MSKITGFLACKSARILAGSIAALLALQTVQPAHAAVLNWDGLDAVTTGAQGGSGTWNANSLVNWWNDATDVVWPLAGTDNDAVFGETPGTVTLGAGGVSANDLTFTTGGYILSGAGTLTLNGIASNIITTGAGITATIGNGTATVLAGASGMIKAGAGTLTLDGSAAHAYTGVTTISGGTLALDFANLATPTNLINGASALSLGGGALTIKAQSGAASTSQTFASTTVNAGGGSILIDPSNGGGVSVSLGSLGTLTSYAAGSSLVVGKAVTANTGAVNIATTTLPTNGLADGSGIYGGRIVFANGTADTGYDWATTTSGVAPYTLSAYSGYTAFAAAGTATATNYLQSGSISGVGTESVNTLKVIATSAGESLTQTAATTLTINGGGLLATGADAYTISGGTLVGGSSGIGAFDLIVHQYNSGGLTIGSTINNNGVNATSLTKAGTGTLVLTGTNNFTGGLRVNSGTVQISGTSRAQGLGTVTVNSGGTLDLTGNTGTNALAYTGSGLIKFTGTTSRVTWSGTVSTFTGTVEIGDGTNVAQVNLGTPTGIANDTFSLVRVRSGSQLHLYNTAYAGTTELSGGWNGDMYGQLRLDGTTTAPLLGPVTLTGNTTIGGNFGGLSGNIGQSGGSYGIEFRGITTLSGNSTYSGTTLIGGSSGSDFGGDIRLGSNPVGTVGAIVSSPLGTGDLVFNAVAGTATLSSSSTTARTVLNTVTFNSNATLGSSANNGKLTFSANAALGAANRTLTVNSDAQFDGVVSSSGAFGINKAGTAALTFTAANTYSGATNVNAGTLALGGASGSLLATTGIRLANGATLLLSNDLAQASLNRVNDVGTITSLGGSIAMTNVLRPVSYAEKVGSVVLNGGQNNFVLGTNFTAAGAAQTLSVALTRNNRSTVTYSNAGGALALNSTGNRIQVSGATATPAGHIIGPWATTGTTAAQQTDYAVFDAAGNVLASNVLSALGSKPAGDSATWTNPLQTYTIGFLGGNSGANAFSATTHDMAALRNFAAFGNFSPTLTAIRAGDNLNTFGLLNASGGSWTISAIGNGAISTPAGGGELYVNTGRGAITLSAPIIDNGGAVSVLKTGIAGALTITNTNNTYSGATVLNAGTLVLNATSGALADVNTASSIGRGSAAGSNADLVFNGGTLQYTGANAVSTNRLFSVGVIGGTIDSSGGTLGFTGTGAMGFDGISGARTLSLTGSNAGTPAATSGSNQTQSTLALLIGDNGGATSINKTGSGTWVLSNPASTYTGATNVTAGILNVGTFAAANAPSGLGLGTGSNTDLVLNGGTLQYSGGSAATTDRTFSVGLNGGTIDSSAANPLHTLSFTGSGAMGFNNQNGTHTLTLGGTNTGANTMNVQLGDFGAPTALTKTGSGTWFLTNTANNYTGVTTISGGILNVPSLANVNTPSVIGQGSLAGSAGDLVLSGGTLQYTNNSAPLTTNRLFTVGPGGGTIDSSAANPANAVSFTSTGLLGFSGSAALTLTGSNTGANVIASAIANNPGTAAVTKSGSGTWTLSGANTYTGATTVNAGTLTIAGTTGATNVTITGGTLNIGNGTTGSLNGVTGSALFLSGSGTFNVNKAAGVLQSMTGLTLLSGSSTVQSTNNGGNAALTFASMGARPAGSSVNFITSGGMNGTTNKIAITQFPAGTATPTAALLNKGVFFGGSNYAAYDTLGFVRALNYGADANTLAAIASGATLGVDDITKNVALTGDITAQTTASVNTLKLGASNLTLASATDVLTTNGLLSSGNASASIIGGKFQSAASGELVVRVDDSADKLTIGSVIQNNTSTVLTKSGDGTLVLTGSNAYTGATHVGGGVLEIGGAGTLNNGNYAGSIAVVNGATLNFTTSANQTLGAAFTGSGRVNLSSGSTLTLLAARGASSPTITATNNSALAGTLAALGTGPASDLVLDGAVLRVNDTGVGTVENGARGFTLGANGATIQLGDLNGTLTGSNTIQSNFTSTAPIAFTGSGARTLKLESAVMNPSTFSPALGDSATGATSLVIGGTPGANGIWALDGANTFSGTTTINTGSLSIRKVQAANGGTAYFAPSNLSVAAGSSLAIGVGAAPTYFDATAIATVLDGAHLGASTATTGLKTGAQFGLDTTAGEFTYTGTLSNLSGGNVLNFAKHGAGVLTLSGANTYTGTTTIYGSTGTSTLRAGSATALGPASSASLAFGYGNANVVQKVQLFGNNITVIGLNSPVADWRSGHGEMYLESGSDDVSGAGVDVLTVNTPALSTSTWNNGATLNGGISRVQDGGARKLGITKDGAGTLELGGTNTYTGGTIMQAGVLRALSTSAFGGATGTLTFGAASSGVVQLNGNSITVAALNTDATPGTTFVENGNAGGATLTVNNTTANTFAGVLQDGAAGVLALTKSNAGSLTLSGNNSFTGLTTVSAGTLVLSGNNAAACGGLSINGGVVQFNSVASINGTTRNVAVNLGGAVAFAPTFGSGAPDIASAMLTRINPSSAGAIAADNYAGAAFDFSVAGLTNASLGAVGNITFTGLLTPNGTTYRLGGGGGALTYPNAITGAGNALTITGPGTVALTNAGNTYGGATTVNSGTLTVSGTGIIGAGALSVNGGTLDLAGANATVDAVSITGGIIANGTLSGTSYTGSGGTISAVLSGVGVTFTNTGGVTTLNAANTFGGGTNITGGTLRAFAPGSLSTGLVTLTGGNLSLANDGNGNSSAQGISYGNNVTVSANANIAVGQFTSAETTNAANKTLQLGTLSIGAQTLSVTNNNGFGLEFGNATFTGAPTINVGVASVSSALPGLTLDSVASGGGAPSGAGATILTVTGVATGNVSSALLLSGNNAATFGTAANQVISINSGSLAAATDEALGQTGATGNVIQLNTNSSVQGFRATGTFATARPFRLNTAANSIAVTQGSTLTLTTPFTFSAGTNNLTKNDLGTLELNASNSTAWTTGQMNVAQGVVKVSILTALGQTGGSTLVQDPSALVGGVAGNGGAALQLNAAALDTLTVTEPLSIAGSGINSGGALQAVGGTNVTSRSVSTSGAITLSGAATIGASAFTTLNLNSAISGAQALTLGGAGSINLSTPLPAITSLTKTGGGTMHFTATSPLFITPLTLHSGTFLLDGNGLIASPADPLPPTSTVVNPGVTITLDNTLFTLPDRLGGSNRTLTVAGAQINYLGTNLGKSNETFGPLTVASGQSTFTVIAQPSKETNTSFASNPVVHNIGGTMLFRATNLGGVAGPGIGTIISDNKNAGFVFIGAAGAVSTTSKAILPWALADNNTATGVGTSFATADTGFDVLRVLNPTTEMATNTFTANTNVLLTSAQTAGTAAGLTINSLTMNNAASGVTIPVGSSVQLSSGGLLATVANAGISGGYFNSATLTREMIVHALGSFSISSVIGNGANTFTGSFTKSGAGNLTLTGLNNYQGTTTVNQGTLTLANGSDNSLAIGKPLVVNFHSTNIGTLDLGARNQYVGTLNSAGPAEGAGGNIIGLGILTTTLGGTFGGNIGGAVSLTKAMTNTLTLTAVNVTTGNVQVLGGTLSLKDGGSLLGSTGTLGIKDATLAIDNTGSKDVADRVSDSQAIALNGGTISFLGRSASNSTETLGNVSLNSGLNTITAVTSGPAAGEITKSATLTLSGLTRSFGAVLNVNDNAGGNSAMGQLGNNSRVLVTAPLAGNLAPVNGVVPGAYMSSQADRFDLVGYAPGLGFGALGTAGFAQYYQPGGNNLLGADTTRNVRFQTGGGTVATGGQTINSLHMSPDGGGGAVNFVNANDKLTVSSGMVILGGTQPIGSVAVRGAVTSGAGQELHFIQRSGTSGQSNINAVITDNGSPVTLVVTNPGGTAVNPILTAHNTYTGGTIVNGGGLDLISTNPGDVPVPAGGLALNNASVTMFNNAGQIDSANVITLNGPSSITFVGNNAIAGLVFNSDGGLTAPTVSPAGILTLANTGNVTSTPTNVAVAPIISGGTLDLDDQIAHNITVAAIPTAPFLTGLTISSQIQSLDAASGGFTKLGNGVLQLSGGNTFTGGLNINAGAVLASSTFALGGATNTVTLNNSAALWLNNASVGAAANTIVVGAGGGALASVGGDRTLSSPISLTGALSVSLADPTLNSTDRSVTIGSAITGGGSLVVSGNINNITSTAKVLSVTATNTFTGGTTINNGGVLQPSGIATLGASSGSLTIHTGGTLDLNNTNQSVGNLTGTGGRIVNNSGASLKTLTIGGGDTGGGNFAGVIANNSTGTGTIALNKVGTGTITLSGANTYTGPTTISAGALDLSGSLSSTSIQIDGGTLLLSGTSGAQVSNLAAVTLNGGALAMSGSSVSKTIGSLTLNANSLIDFGAGLGNLLSFDLGILTHTAGTTLSINGWTGLVNTLGTSLTDRLIFTGSAGVFTSLFSQSDIIFGGFGIGYSVIPFNGGTQFEVVAAPASSNADLASMVLTTATLSPVFSSTTITYTATVPNTTTTLTLTPTVADANATVKVNTVSVPSGIASGAMNLSYGANLINVVVTAQSGATKTYSVTVTRQTPLETWRQFHFGIASNTGVAADNFDYDNDGLVNLLEYALGTIPTTPSTAPTVQVNGSGRLQLQFTRPTGRTDISTFGEYSTNLTAWFGTTAVVETFITNLGNGTDQVTIRESLSTPAQPRRFLRIRVETL